MEYMHYQNALEQNCGNTAGISMFGLVKAYMKGFRPSPRGVVLIVRA